MSRRRFLRLAGIAGLGATAALAFSYGEPVMDAVSDWLFLGPEDFEWALVDYEKQPSYVIWVRDNVTRKFRDINGDLKYNSNLFIDLIKEKNMTEYGKFSWDESGQILIPVGEIDSASPKFRLTD